MQVVCVLQCVAVCCSVLQCVAVCCSVLQCVAVCCSVLQCGAMCCSETFYSWVVRAIRLSWCSVLQSVAVFVRCPRKSSAQVIWPSNLHIFSGTHPPCRRAHAREMQNTLQHSVALQHTLQHSVMLQHTLTAAHTCSTQSPSRSTGRFRCCLDVDARK